MNAGSHETDKRKSIYQESDEEGLAKYYAFFSAFIAVSWCHVLFLILNEAVWA